MRTVLRSLAAAVAAMLIPWSAGIWVAHEPIAQLPDGSWDDAPYRAAMVFLILSPCPLLGLSVFFPGVAALLRPTTGGDKLVHLLAVDLALALLFGGLFALDGYRMFGLRDALISFADFGVGTVLSLGLGSITWCALRPRSREPLEAASTR